MQLITRIKPADLLASTIGEDGRREAMEFAAGSKKIMEYLGEEDAGIVKEAIASHKGAKSSGESI